MRSQNSLSCTPAGAGGVTLTAESPQARMTMPLDRGNALAIAASILRNAGVREATFRDGTLSGVR